jgi:hypothetical protein
MGRRSIRGRWFFSKDYSAGKSEAVNGMHCLQRAVSQDAGITSRGQNILLFLWRGSREKCVNAATSRSRQHVSGKPLYMYLNANYSSYCTKFSSCFSVLV